MFLETWGFLEKLGIAVNFGKRIKFKMGGQQSRTRKLTIENEDPAKVIVLSEEVANRLKGSQG